MCQQSPAHLQMPRRRAHFEGERDVAMPIKPREIIVNDRMQIGYRYLLTKPADVASTRFPTRAHAEANAGTRGVRRQVHDGLP